MDITPDMQSLMEDTFTLGGSASLDGSGRHEAVQRHTAAVTWGSPRQRRGRADEGLGICSRKCSTLRVAYLRLHGYGIRSLNTAGPRQFLVCTAGRICRTGRSSWVGMDITSDMQSLFEKFDAMELTEGERTAFGHLFGVGDDDEVEGFVYLKYELKNVAAQGFIMNIGVGELQECTISKASGKR